MPFKSTFANLKSQLKDLQQEGQKLLSERSQSQQQAQPGYPAQQQGYGQGPPPPVPHGTHPGAASTSSVYWQPRFDPATGVAAEWEHKIGNNNGWGNNEMQHYTDRPENSFYTPDGLLVLRAISQPSHPDLAQRYTSARLVSRQRLSRPSGSLVATLTLPCALGVWPAFWLLPFEPFAWPRDGEVDVAETWNGDGVNHSCLHWGFYTPEDRDKHRVVGTPVQGMQSGRPIRFEFAWNEKGLVWWIDGRPVMKAPLPKGTRPMSDFVVLLNIAMGGNVCQGRLPRPDTTHDLVVHDLRLLAEPEAGGGWQGFDQAYRQARQGDTIG